MELSENERLMLVKKKEEIFKITSELLTNGLSKSEKISKMNEILSLLSTIESYAKPDRDLSVFQEHVNKVSGMLHMGMNSELLISIFCTAVNSIKFDFSKKGVLISIPIKIKEAILNKNQFG
jgi:hypothetical protein